MLSGVVLFCFGSSLISSSVFRLSFGRRGVLLSKRIHRINKLISKCHDDLELKKLRIKGFELQLSYYKAMFSPLVFSLVSSILLFGLMVFMFKDYKLSFFGFSFGLFGIYFVCNLVFSWFINRYFRLHFTF